MTPRTTATCFCIVYYYNVYPFISVNRGDGRFCPTIDDGDAHGGFARSVYRRNDGPCTRLLVTTVCARHVKKLTKLDVGNAVPSAVVAEWYGALLRQFRRTDVVRNELPLRP